MMASFDREQLFTIVSLVLLISLTATSIGEDTTLTSESKPKLLQAAQAFYFIALFAFVFALILYSVYTFKFRSKALKYAYIALIVSGFVCAVLSVIMYYQAFSKYRTVKPESNSWLIAAIMAAFQLSVKIVSVSLVRTDEKSVRSECYTTRDDCCPSDDEEEIPGSFVSVLISRRSWYRIYLSAHMTYIDINKAVLIVLLNTPEGEVYYFQPLTHDAKSCSELLKLPYEINGEFIKDSSGNILYTYIAKHKATQLYHKDEIFGSPVNVSRPETLYIECKTFLLPEYEIYAYFLNKDTEARCTSKSYTKLNGNEHAIGFTEGIQIKYDYWEWTGIAKFACEINRSGIIMVYTTTTQNMDRVKSDIRHQISILYNRVNEKEFDIYLNEDLDTDYRLFAVKLKSKIYHDISETISLLVP
ncbi:unnamed protein product [Trichobilharzia szidati]|nr:unnamed protein product [Trichobilharzia szidati]